MSLDRPVSVVAFDPSHLALVQRFTQTYWPARPHDLAFLEWRYLQCRAFSRCFVAVQDDALVGMIFGLQKQYVVNGASVVCLEVCDWHALPEFKGSGVGIRLMRAMMRQPERLLAVGGTADVHKTLPAMGWQTLPGALAYERRVSGDALAETLERRTGAPRWLSRAPLAIVAATLFRPRRAPAPPGGGVERSPQAAADLDALYTGGATSLTAQRPTLDLLSWTTRAPFANGEFEVLRFRVGDRLRGWALTRVYETPAGRKAAILDIFNPDADPDLYRWMVSEAAVSVMRASPRLIRARATAPSLQAALAANGFRAAATDVPIFTSPKGWDGGASLHLTMNHADEPLRPYGGVLTSPD